MDCIYVYLLSTIITNNPDFQSNKSSLRGKRNFFIVMKLYCSWIITKEAKIMDLTKTCNKVRENDIFLRKSVHMQL